MGIKTPRKDIVQNDSKSKESIATLKNLYWGKLGRGEGSVQFILEVVFSAQLLMNSEATILIPFVNNLVSNLVILLADYQLSSP